LRHWSPRRDRARGFLLISGAAPELPELPWPVVMKPFSPQALVAAVAVLLSSAGRGSLG
jgi:hypothetical protein